jgi:predicted RNA-binding protein associated with RNAse of E/G family
MIVAADREERLALWCPKGTIRVVPMTPPSRPRAPTRAERLACCLALGDWVLAEREWDTSTLWLLEPGAAHAIWVSWRENGEHLGWYVNLQEPFRRSQRRLQTMDHALDVVVEPGGDWRWKDEDELEAMRAHGLIDAGTARAVRAEGERVIRRLEAGEPPFSEPWADWRPDPSWDLPVLPPGWDRV